MDGRMEKRILVDTGKLIDLVQRGRTNAEIADELQISTATVSRRLSELGVTRVKTSFNISVAEYMRMRERGLSDEDIAYVFDVSRNTVFRFKKRHGLYDYRRSQT
jgi:DNA-binding CsgD family transcriptional regulator